MLHRVWKGAGADNRMHHSSAPDNEHWHGEHPIERHAQEPVGFTSHGPALAFVNNTLNLVWKGVPGDPGMFHATSTDGLNWAGGGAPIGGVTSHRPALAVLGGRLHRVWKHADDASMRISGISPPAEAFWSQEQPIGGLTSHGPALAADPGGTLYRVFKGPDGDTRMHISFSTNGGQIWTESIPIMRTNGEILGRTSEGPALAFLGNRLHLVWKGVPGDASMFHATSTDGVKWDGGELPIGGRTLDGPALAAGPGGRLYRLWRTEAGDEINLSRSIGIGADGRPQWEPENPVTGHTSSSPALVGF